MTRLDNTRMRLLIEDVISLSFFNFYLHKSYDFLHNAIMGKCMAPLTIKTKYYSELRPDDDTAHELQHID